MKEMPQVYPEHHHIALYRCDFILNKAEMAFLKIKHESKTMKRMAQLRIDLYVFRPTNNLIISE